MYKYKHVLSSFSVFWTLASHPLSLSLSLSLYLCGNFTVLIGNSSVNRIALQPSKASKNVESFMTGNLYIYKTTWQFISINYRVNVYLNARDITLHHFIIFNRFIVI